ncbi:MAG: hypothetical protein KKB20_06440 [Proteobacteria bacterium]|nr:hypothetical protein [Pseudomonadota bacterium]
MTKKRLWQMIGFSILFTGLMLDGYEGYRYVTMGADYELAAVVTVKILSGFFVILVGLLIGWVSVTADF